MPVEMVYTSARTGLARNSQGFCTVAATRGAPATLLQKLEQLTGYKPPFGVDDPRNPTNCFSLRLAISGKTYQVVGRVGPCGIDYTGRANKLAHLIALEPGELPPGGPTALLSVPGLFLNEWDGEARHLEPRTLSCPNSEPGVPRSWAALTGDAGHAGAVLDKLRAKVPVTLLLPWGRDPLPLINETLALLPEGRRWDAAFATFPGSLPPDIAVDLKCYPVESDEGIKAKKLPVGYVLTLAPGAPAASGPGAEAARIGRPIADAARPAPLRAGAVVAARPAEEVFEGEPGVEEPSSAGQRAVLAGLQQQLQGQDDPSAPIKVDHEFHLGPPGGGWSKAVMLFIGLLVGGGAASAAFLATRGEPEARAATDDNRDTAANPPSDTEHQGSVEEGRRGEAEARLRKAHDAKVAELNRTIAGLTRDRDAKSIDATQLASELKMLNEAKGKVESDYRLLKSALDREKELLGFFGYPADPDPIRSLYSTRGKWAIIPVPPNSGIKPSVAAFDAGGPAKSDSPVRSIRLVPAVEKHEVKIKGSNVKLTGRPAGPNMVFEYDNPNVKGSVTAATLVRSPEGLTLTLDGEVIKAKDDCLNEILKLVTDKLVAVTSDDGVRYFESFERVGETATLTWASGAFDTKAQLPASNPGYERQELLVPHQNLFDGVIRLKEPTLHFLRVQFGRKTDPRVKTVLNLLDLPPDNPPSPEPKKK